MGRRSAPGRSRHSAALNPKVRFEEEAEVEYRLAGRWYEDRRQHLGVEFFDAVDAAIDRIVAMPRVGSQGSGVPADLAVRRRAVTRFPYHSAEDTWTRKPAKNKPKSGVLASGCIVASERALLGP